MNSRVPLVILTAFVTFLLTSALWIAGGWFLYQRFGEESGDLLVNDPPDFVVRLEHPEPIRVGDTFPLRIAVSNPSEVAIELGSIDVYDSLLEGFELLGTSPQPVDRMAILDFQSFGLDQRLEPGDRFEFELSLQATTVGTWTGDIDACTPEEDFVTEVAALVVLAAEAAGEAP